MTGKERGSKKAGDSSRVTQQEDAEPGPAWRFLLSGPKLKLPQPGLSSLLHSNGPKTAGRWQQGRKGPGQGSEGVQGEGGGELECLALLLSPKAS